MSYSVTWTETALNELRQLDPAVARRIVQAVDRFAIAEQGNVRQLTGYDPPEWRLRVGDWRVRFNGNSQERGIVILHVLHRSEAYRGR